ncbi:MAG: DNA repair protein RecO [Candidatus Magasanikbacteria bacterium]
MKAVILSRRDWREHDQIISLYTREHGKIEALARGVKKILSKNSAYLEPGCFVEAEIIPGKKDWAHLGSVTPINIFKNMRADLSASLAVGYAMNLADKNIHAGEADQRMFEMISGWLNWMDSTTVIPSKARDLQPLFLIVFITKFLALLGFDPSTGISDNNFHDNLKIITFGTWEAIGQLEPIMTDMIKIQKYLYHFANQYLESKINNWAKIGQI